MCLLTFSVYHFVKWSIFCSGLCRWFNQRTSQLSPVPVSQMAGAGPLTCHVSRVHTLAYPTVRTNIRYLFIRRVHFVLHTIHTIQSHSAGLSLPPCLRARGVYIAWRGAAWGGGGLARPRDPDPGAAAATNGRQPRAPARGHAQEVARAGTSKTSTYCWMRRRERKNDFLHYFARFIAVFLSPKCDQIWFLKIFLFRWTRTRTSAIDCNRM